ncbi:hypothetical protein JZ751_007234 [Albula glossodonta]|uniref:Uncharacterized protein n=1 Tax=Albula glossodonta TaxID=121402 RepID=A0A8T2N2K6_9TELE|nr:hypothetical protein JZ751_007234 [Albula glossodonta]
MSDSDLFMECEEEDLEPWQQIDDKVQEEEVALEEKTKASTGKASTSSHSKGPKVTGLTDGTVATTTPTSTPATAPPAPTPPPPPPVLTPVMLPSLAPQQQLILAQGPASLGSVPHLLHHMPVVSTGQTGGVAGQPVIFTTQDPTQTQTPVRPLTPDSLGLVGERVLLHARVMGYEITAQDQSSLIEGESQQRLLVECERDAL